GNGGSVEKLEATVQDIKTQLAGPGIAANPAPPAPQTPAVSDAVPCVFNLGWIGPVVGPLGTAGFVMTMLIFMLLERRDLRDRLFGLIGQGHLALTTKAFAEAGKRVSRQLLM